MSADCKTASADTLRFGVRGVTGSSEAAAAAAVVVDLLLLFAMVLVRGGGALTLDLCFAFWLLDVEEALRLLGETTAVGAGTDDDDDLLGETTAAGTDADDDLLGDTTAAGADADEDLLGETTGAAAADDDLLGETTAAAAADAEADDDLLPGFVGDVTGTTTISSSSSTTPPSTSGGGATSANVLCGNGGCGYFLGESGSSSCNGMGLPNRIGIISEILLLRLLPSLLVAVAPSSLLVSFFCLLLMLNCFDFPLGANGGGGGNCKFDDELNVLDAFLCLPADND